jgi:hypothetical protein
LGCILIINLPKKGEVFGNAIPPTPSQKTKEIVELAKKAKIDVGDAEAINPVVVKLSKPVTWVEYLAV